MPQPTLPLIVEADELEGHLAHRDLLIVDLSNQQTHVTYHVPGAVSLAYEAIVEARPPAMGLLPGAEQLSNALSSIGMTPETHVVAYDDEANGKACRLLWTLDVIGHQYFSLLNGGLHAWVNEGHVTEKGSNQPRQGEYRVTPRTEAVADKAYILARLGNPDTVILDTRSPAEFTGADKRAARGGHIPGAVNMDWIRAIDRERGLRLKAESELQGLLENLGVTPNKEVITHCQVHHRSSHTYVALKSFGFPRIKGYPGSWSEWGNDLKLPIEI